MTEEELAAIRRRATLGWQTPEVKPPLPEIVAGAVHDVAALLAEVDRLRAEVADLLGVCESLVINPNAKPILEDYRLAIAAIRSENAAMRPIVEAVAFASVRPTPAHRGDIHIEIEILNAIQDQARDLLAKDGDA
jgi:hypothetical protein